MKKFAYGLAMAVGLFSWSSLQADPISVVLDGSPTAVADGFEFKYELHFVTPAEEVVTGNEFIIYDFAGLVFKPGGPLVFAPADWAISVELETPPVAGSTLATLDPPESDDPFLHNLVFEYTGAAPLTSTPISGFSAVSIFENTTLDAFSASVKNTVTGLTNGATGHVHVPEAVPAPSSFVLFAIGTTVVGGLRRWRRRSKA